MINCRVQNMLCRIVQNIMSLLLGLNNEVTRGSSYSSVMLVILLLR